MNFPLQKSFPKFAILIPLVTLAPLSAHAQSTWTGATSTDYNTASNWSTGIAPTASTAEVIINSSAANPTAFNGEFTRDIGSNTAITDTGSLTLNGGNGRWFTGNTTLSGDGSVTMSQGSARFINRGAFTMSGGTFMMTDGEYFVVGHEAVGAFNQSAGTVTANLKFGFFLSNNSTNESGTSYALSGGTLVVNSAATHPDVNLRGVHFGKGSADGSQTPGDLFHATAGTATFTRTGTNSSFVAISRNSKLQVSGSSTVTFDNYSGFRVGFDEEGTTGNAVIVDGGTLNITGATPDLNIGWQDDGSLTISSGILNLDGFLFIGGDLTSTLDGIGTVTMTGGSLFAESIQALNGSSIFNFSGGTITLEGNQTDIINESWFSGAAVASYDSLNGVTIIAVPEPATVGLVLTGIFGLLAFRRRHGR